MRTNSKPESISLAISRLKSGVISGLGLLQLQDEPGGPVVLPPALRHAEREMGLDQIEVNSRLPRLLKQLCLRFHARSKPVSFRPSKPNAGRTERGLLVTS